MESKILLELVANILKKHKVSFVEVFGVSSYAVSGSNKTTYKATLFFNVDGIMQYRVNCCEEFAAYSTEQLELILSQFFISKNKQIMVS